jgi:rhamnopyranosyl-N-acetylglucosaminyl-diphospho-decaprenol beta-1,3/1,4-galactofuranosyltransferase
VNSVPDNIVIAIVTFNRSALLKGLLASAAAMNTQADRIVVIDNASTDDTDEVVASAMADFKPGQLVHHRMETNTGGAGGFSEGTKVALENGADWVWLMDDDVEILPDALERFAPWMARFHCIHGRRYDVDGSPFYWQAKFNNFLAVPLPYGRNAFTDEGFAITNSGTFEGMLIHADVVRQIGLPDPRFFISWDDAVYAWVASQVTDVVYVDAYVLQKKRDQKQISLAGIRHFNDSSPLARYHVMRNRAYVAKYFEAHGQLNRLGFAIGTFLTFAKEIFRLVAVDHTLKGTGDLVRGMRDSRKLLADKTWKPMDPKDVPAAQH